MPDLITPFEMKCNIDLKINENYTMFNDIHLRNCRLETYNTTYNTPSRNDLFHITSIITIYKILVEKNIISRKELEEAEKYAAEYIEYLKNGNDDFLQEEDKLVLQLKNFMPDHYAQLDYKNWYTE